METWIAFVLGLSTGALGVCAFVAWGLLQTVDANTAESELHRAYLRMMTLEARGHFVMGYVPDVPFIMPESRN